MGADDFLVTPANRDAAAWIGKWPDWPAHGLVITGSSGSGKTHLVNLWLAKNGGRFVAFPELAGQDAASLTASTKYIAIDNADAVAGHAVAEEKLFHLYNHLKAVKGSLLLTMAQGAGQAGFVLPDLRSRLLALPAVTLGAPDDALLSALIVKQFRDRQIAIEAGVVDLSDNARRTRRRRHSQPGRTARPRRIGRRAQDYGGASAQGSGRNR